MKAGNLKRNEMLQARLSAVRFITAEVKCSPTHAHTHTYIPIQRHNLLSLVAMQTKVLSAANRLQAEYTFGVF